MVMMERSLHGENGGTGLMESTDDSPSSSSQFFKGKHNLL